ncbi:hypothetical protein [Sphingomonas sp. UBA4815]|uniref:hypothetical protein n=1 Tax=Sphingomonas sp. UBA4815 TaxID=1947533 RepID=UPI0031F5DA39
MRKSHDAASPRPRYRNRAPIDRDTRRARLLAARRYAINSVPRRGILSGHWDAGTVVGAFRDGKAG